MIRPRSRSFRSFLALGFVLLVAARPPSSAAQEVVLPIAEYDRLLQAVEGDEVDPALDYAFLSAKIRVDAERSTGAQHSADATPDTARVRQELAIHVFSDQRVRIPVTRAGGWIGFEVVQSPGSSAAAHLSGEGGTNGEIELRGPGRYRLVLRSVHPLEAVEGSAAGERTLHLGLPDAAALDATLNAPGVREVVSADVECRLIQGSRPDDAATWQLLPGDSRGQVELTLRNSMSGDGAADQPLRFGVTSATDTRLGRLRTDAAARIDIDVWQGRLEDMELLLPPGLDVVEVTSEAVADWHLDGRRLTLEMSTPILTGLTADIALTGRGIASDDSIAAPLAEVPHAADQVLRSSVRLEGDGILSLDDAGSGREARRAGTRRRHPASPGRPTPRVSSPAR